MEQEKSIHTGLIMIRGKGTGFFSLPSLKEDIVINPPDLNCALDGDTVEIELKKAIPGKRQEGVVRRVLTRTHTEFIGALQKKGAITQFVSDNRRIHIRPIITNATDTHFGKKVVVRIQEWKNPLTDPLAEIIDVIGTIGDHETEMQAIIRSGGFSTAFPHDVAEAARSLYESKDAIFKKAVADTTGDHPTRRDMRDRTTCTIDPVDAKDFDDALSIHELKPDLYEIGIHIADVSHYIQENDVIDREAQSRGTSIYLVDRVIPMLPEELSNDLCSLRPNEDRLSFSAVFHIDIHGTIHDEWYGQTIIHSNKRFSYEEAQSVLDAGSGTLHDELATLMCIGRILRTERFKNGAIAFEQPEVKFELDEAGKPLRVYEKVRTETMLMIEDFMLLANKRVAEYINTESEKRKQHLGFVYRVHDVPNPDKIEQLTIFLHAMGYEFKTDRGSVHAKEINTLLESVTGKPEEFLIKTAAIRSMAKAIYTTKNIGHFGLAFPHYTHFTSPIRRYPDLMVHRLLTRHLRRVPLPAGDLARYESLASQSSEREMQAVSAERDSIKFKQVEYMSGQVGNTFTGIITGVTDWGLYVEEKESHCEGMIRLSSIKNDYYTHEPHSYRIKGERTGRTYTLGSEVKVKLTRADMEEHTLDFELV